MKNFMLIKRVSDFMYVGYAENVNDIPRRGVEQFDVLVPGSIDPLLRMRARCIFHLPYNCFLISAVEGTEREELMGQMKTHCKHNMELFEKTVHGREQKAIGQILAELHDAEIEHPNWPEEAISAASIVVEEAGELLRDCATYEENGDRKLIETMQIEAIQTGAMAVRFLKNLHVSNRRTIPASTLRSILDSDSSIEDQVASIRDLIVQGGC